MRKVDAQEALYDSTLTYASGAEKKTVRVRKRLGFADFGAAAEVAVNALYVNGMYKPYLKQYALAATVVQFYTDYDGTLEPDAFMRLVRQEDFYPRLRAMIEEAQYFQLEDTVEEMTAYRNSSAPMGAFFRELLEAAARGELSAGKADQEQKGA